MKESITKHVKLISVLICLGIFIMQVFIGCGESYTPQKNSKLRLQSDFINYIAENFDEYKDRIKDESGFEGKIVNEGKDGKEQQYIEFVIDDTTKIKFKVNASAVIITKQLAPSSKFDYKREIEMFFSGMIEKSNILITLYGNGLISCDYEANDLEHPLPSQKEKDEGIDSQIKQNISTKELEELSSKAHSIYNVFEEICNEYNEKNEK